MIGKPARVLSISGHRLFTHYPLKSCMPLEFCGSDVFDRCLETARRAGAIGELDPQFHNYHDVPTLSL